jgi:hypothetical protein
MSRHLSFRRAIAAALAGEVAVDKDDLCDDARAAVTQVESMQGALSQLLLAYAKADDARTTPSGHVEWDDLNLAVEYAKGAMPGEYERLVARLNDQDAEDEAAKTYRIVRRYRAAPPAETIHSGLTLEQAKAHCSDPGTAGVDWMDTWEEE